MNLKSCSCCKSKLTTKTVTKIGRQVLGSKRLLLYNCKNCNSTGALSAKIKVSEFDSVMASMFFLAHLGIMLQNF
jgi:hypothetical protein